MATKFKGPHVADPEEQELLEARRAWSEAFKQRELETRPALEDMVMHGVLEALGNACAPFSEIWSSADYWMFGGAKDKIVWLDEKKTQFMSQHEVTLTKQQIESALQTLESRGLVKLDAEWKNPVYWITFDGKDRREELTRAMHARMGGIRRELEAKGLKYEF